MAFTNYTISAGEIKEERHSKVASAMATALSAGVTSMSAIGGQAALGVACSAFINAWRKFNPDTARLLSANKTISVQASSTGTLVTVQFQF